MKYILVTDFEKHWDKLEQNFTSFPKQMLHRELMKAPLVDGTKTIFIKKKKWSGTIERCWIGTVRDIQFIGGKVYFRAEVLREEDCPIEYSSYPNGWFCDSGD